MPILQDRRFAPRPWAVLLWLAITVAMLLLGRWQLLRADEKIALIEAAEAARAAAPVDVLTLGDGDAIDAALAHRRLSASGRWLSGNQLLWDNRGRGGRPGLEAVTPLLLDDGRALLVNRGWMPLPVRREDLPPLPVTADRVALTGLASRPSRGFAGEVAFVAGAPWPRWLQWFDYDGLAEALDRPLVPLVLQPERAAAPGPATGPSGSAGPAGGPITDPSGDAPGGPSGGTPADPLADPRDGAAAAPVDAARGAAVAGATDLLVEHWQPAASGPEKHWSYAVQWFGMAAAFTVLFASANLRRRTAGPAPGPAPAPPPDAASKVGPASRPIPTAAGSAAASTPTESDDP